jgi:hypothetical protein
VTECICNVAPAIEKTDRIRKTSSELTSADTWDHIQARSVIKRNEHRVDTGLYALGNPGPESPVLVDGVRYRGGEIAPTDANISHGSRSTSQYLSHNIFDGDIRNAILLCQEPCMNRPLLIRSIGRQKARIRLLGCRALRSGSLH